jgi:hypothetical protein
MGSFARTRNSHVSDREQKRPSVVPAQGASALGVTGPAGAPRSGNPVQPWAMRRRRKGRAPLTAISNPARGDSTEQPGISPRVRPKDAERNDVNGSRSVRALRRLLQQVPKGRRERLNGHGQHHQPEDDSQQTACDDIRRGADPQRGARERARTTRGGHHPLPFCRRRSRTMRAALGMVSTRRAKVQVRCTEMRRHPDEGVAPRPAGSRAFHGAQDRRGSALDALQRLCQGLTIPAIDLQVVDARCQRFDAGARTHHECDGFRLEFAGVK